MGRAFEFRVPHGSDPDCKLCIPLDGEDVQVQMPGNAEPGDVLCMAQRSDGSWRIVRKTTEFSFVLPTGCVPGENLSLKAPDGRSLLFPVPENTEPGNLVYLKKPDAGGWTFDKYCVMPEVDESPEPLDWVSGPYASMLKLLNKKGYLSNVPLDEIGQLHVNIPFCGRFHEYAVLGDFIAESCLSLPGVTGARIFCTEVVDKYSYDWARATRWYAKVRPGIRLETCVQDLTQDPLPHAGLTIGVHPEVTKGGYWFQIIGSILRSGAKGLCAFATFFEAEMKTLLNMVEIYRGEVVSVEVIENPHYEIHTKPASPPLCYIVLVMGSSFYSGRCMTRSE